MIEIKFIKDHSSNRFKKGQTIKVEEESVGVWLKSGYVVLANEEADLGNVEGSTKDLSDSKQKSTGQSKFGKGKKNKKKNKK